MIYSIYYSNRVFYTYIIEQSKTESSKIEFIFYLIFEIYVIVSYTSLIVYSYYIWQVLYIYIYALNNGS